MKKTESSDQMMGIEKDVPAEQQSISFMQPPAPIHVEVENFQLLVQSLTAGKRKRKTVGVVDDVDIEEVQVAQKSASQPAKVQKQVQSLLEYLDLLDQECAPPSKVSANRGFFATAGLVKGVDIEEGLRQLESPPDSPQGPLPEEPISIRSFAKKLSPLTMLPYSTLLCPEWEEGPCCLSPRSYQVVKHAQRAAKHALKAREDFPGSGPFKLSLQKIGDVERLSEPSEWGYPGHPIDLLWYKGEITFGGETED